MMAVSAADMAVSVPPGRPISLGGIVATARPQPPRLGRPEGHPLEMCLAGVLGAPGSLGRLELAVWVYLDLKLVERRSARGSCSGRTVFGASPGFMGGDLAA
jgi:hypothetical protein